MLSARDRVCTQIPVKSGTPLGRFGVGLDAASFIAAVGGGPPNWAAMSADASVRAAMIVPILPMTTRCFMIGAPQLPVAYLFPDASPNQIWTLRPSAK